MNYRRIGIATLLGAILGVFCIIGVGSRLEGGIESNLIFLIAMWYNRVIMGLMIGFVDGLTIFGDPETKNLPNAAIRGLLFGILVSSAIFLTSEFVDIMGWIAGFAYGIIIDVVSTYFEK